MSIIFLFAYYNDKIKIIHSKYDIYFDTKYYTQRNPLFQKC